MKDYFKKITAFAVASALSAASIGPATAVAYFSETEISNGSVIIKAGTLDIQGDFVPFADYIMPGSQTSALVGFTDESTLPLLYSIEVERISCPDDFYNALTATVRVGGSTITTPLPALGKAGPFSEPTAAWIDFALAKSSSVTDGAACKLSAKFVAWQRSLPGPEQGFTDSLSIPMTLTASVAPVYTGPEVVINEIMWMGSRGDDGKIDQNDEWIELRNMTGKQIDISGWTLENVGSGKSNNLTLDANTFIPANGFYLIAGKTKADSKMNVDTQLLYGNLNFNNKYKDNKAVVLKNKTGVVIDSTPEATLEAWPAGVHEGGSTKTFEWSMERNLDPKNGASGDDWHTCNAGIMSTTDKVLMASYWDTDAAKNNCGTPGAANLSANDPTAPDFDPLTLDSILLPLRVSDVPAGTSGFPALQDTETVKSGGSETPAMEIPKTGVAQVNQSKNDTEPEPDTPLTPEQTVDQPKDVGTPEAKPADKPSIAGGKPGVVSDPPEATPPVTSVEKIEDQEPVIPIAPPAEPVTEKVPGPEQQDAPPATPVTAESNDIQA